MLKLSLVIDEKTKKVDISENTDNIFAISEGFVVQDVEQAWDGAWYLLGFAPEKPVEELQAQVRAVRNSYLETYVDPKQLVMVWNSLTAEEQELYKDYRQYLLDYPQTEDWYLSNPMTLDEWKQSVEENEELPVVDEVVVSKMENTEENESEEVI